MCGASRNRAGRPGLIHAAMANDENELRYSTLSSVPST